MHVFYKFQPADMQPGTIILHLMNAGDDVLARVERVTEDGTALPATQDAVLDVRDAFHKVGNLQMAYRDAPLRIKLEGVDWNDDWGTLVEAK